MKKELYKVSEIIDIVSSHRPDLKSDKIKNDVYAAFRNKTIEKNQINSLTGAKKLAVSYEDLQKIKKHFDIDEE